MVVEVIFMEELKYKILMEEKGDVVVLVMIIDEVG